MRILNFTVENQSLSKKNDFFNVEGTVGYLYAQFDFLTDDWNGTVKKAIFKNKLVGSKGVLLNDDKCAVPPEVLTKNGLIEVSVEGTSGENYKITTNSAMFLLNKTLSETDVEDFTPDMFQQIVGLLSGKADTLEYKDSILKLLSGETELSRVTITGGSGDGGDAREIELQNDGTYIQWRYVGDEKWTNLVVLSDITGADGKSAYAYAVEGGYTGTEEEFARKMEAEYVGVKDYASTTQAGIVKIGINQGLKMSGQSLVTDQATEKNIAGKKSYQVMNPTMLDYISVQSTHQEMYDTYDPETATTPDGNVSYAYGGRQPVSYTAVKGYVDDGQYDWLKEPVLEVELTEDVTSLYIDTINGETFVFSELACVFSLKGVTEVSNGRLTFAAELITTSYSGIIVANTNGAVNVPQRGMFKVRHNAPLGWHSLFSSGQASSWVSGVQSILRHIPRLDNVDRESSIFPDGDRITKFTIIPYTGFLHAGSTFKIYGRPIKTEEITK